MKTTMKLILVITLFCSTATFAQEPGEQPNGNRCDTCSSATTTNTSNSTSPDDGEQPNGNRGEQTNGTKTSESDTSAGTTSLLDWFLSLLG